MKRVISFLLVFAALFGVFSVCAYADDGIGSVYYVTLPAENDKFTIQPAAGYSVYVPAGQAFEFYIEPKEGYSLKAAIVSVDGAIFYETDTIDEYFPGGHPTRRQYRIDSVTSNMQVFVTNVTTERNADLFEFLIQFFNQIVAFFQELFSGGAAAAIA
ncbi:MAG: hypothetical protein LBS36_11025 [Oscillospiraceae bacterium]|jgi:hypothetical protein|nr:hypothetical protein [Oscillospiraceae bacterium]